MSSLLKVLVVEDSEHDAQLMIEELRRGGYEVICERVETAAGLSTSLDRQEWNLILSDYSLPGFDGQSALNLVRERGLDVPFILVSGTVGEDIAVEAMRRGAHDYLLKDKLARLAPAVRRELREAAVRRDRRRVEESLKYSERLLRRVIDLVPHFIFAKDSKSRHLFANRACAEANGLTSEQMVGRNDLDLVADRVQAEAFMRDDQEVIASGQRKLIPEERLTDHAGRTRILQTVKIPFSAPDTGEPAVLGVSVDISEHKRAEEAIKQRAAELERFHRLSVGREMQMIELKKEVNELAKQIGRPPPYALSFLKAGDESLVRP
jgi:PAS domain S-box-containing protein